jgi:hypothetical protein
VRYGEGKPAQIHALMECMSPDDFFVCDETKESDGPYVPSKLRGGNGPMSIS